MISEQLQGDAVLLYQGILQHHGQISPYFCGRELGWDRRRIGQAMEELVNACILSPDAAVLPRPADQRRKYTLPEAKQRMDEDPAFAQTVCTIERIVGRRLPTADLSALTELYDFHGISPEAMDLLAAQCYDEALLHGEERPTVKRIEKVGLEWARMGIRTREDAVAAIQQIGAREKAVQEIRQRMGLQPEAWIASDERYISVWLEWGFSPEMIELAYDRTVLNCGRLNWKYCHGILESWKGKGLFTPEEVLAKDSQGKPAENKVQEPADDPLHYVT